MAEPERPAIAEYRGGTVYLTMSFAAAVELRRHIVAYLCQPDAPLLPSRDEDILLAVYDALAQVTELQSFFRQRGPA